MHEAVNFCAQCPFCKNEAAQGPRDRNEIRGLLTENSLRFYCGLCEIEWVPSSQELANVERLLSKSARDAAEEFADPRRASA
jgi:hypothetical protein